MIPELGTFALILALFFSALQIFQIRNTAVIGQSIFLTFAMGCLIASLINNDLTVLYVREHAHHSLPLFYKIGAAWGGHEGSLLLWCLILSFWSLAFRLFGQKNIPQKLSQKILMVLGIISSGFILFLLTTSNPFLRNFPQFPITGNDLSPVLQDPGLIFHPPVLYTGYVGCAVGFAFAIAFLLTGKVTRQAAHACRPWIILPWAFLGCGIVSGSWWAYRELGWGGWWFWDPVENASLLPWLSATALFHSLIVSEKRQTFIGWTILLAIVTFTLSLIGTFLVRSGVLVSVHAFANDPTRGLFLLLFLTILIGSSLFLYGLKIGRFYRAINFELFSRETLLLLNTIILLTAIVTILTGTLYPILLDALDLGKISVGEPYFNTIFIPLMLLSLLLMAVAPHVKWQKNSSKKLLNSFWFTLFLNLIIIFIIIFKFKITSPLTVCGIFFSNWLIISTLKYAKQTWRNTNFSNQISMIIAHLGIAVLALGITLNKSYSEEQQIRIHPTEIIQFANNNFYFDSVDVITGTNYQSVLATFILEKNKNFNGKIIAEQRIYTSHNEELSHPGILSGIWGDLYIALGNRFPDGSWSVRLYSRPFVRWIWFGGLLTVLGGLLTIVARIKKTDKKVINIYEKI